jgi:hypothetical protein
VSKDTRIRWTISLRDRDSVLLSFFEPLEKGDRSAICRELMLDGLKYREMAATGAVPAPFPAVPKVTPAPPPPNEVDTLTKRLDDLI